MMDSAEKLSTSADHPTLKYDFEDGIGYWICLTAHALEHILNDKLLALGITYQQWTVLVWLALAGKGLSQAQLAERMRIECSTLTGILERMEDKGWITRESDPEDRRKKIVRPTQQALDDWRSMVDVAHQIRAQAIAGISPTDLDNLRRTLSIILNNLGEELPTHEFRR